MNQPTGPARCYVLLRGERQIVAATTNADDAMDWAVSEIEGSNWIDVPLNPPMREFIEDELA